MFTTRIKNRFKIVASTEYNISDWPISVTEYKFGKFRKGEDDTRWEPGYPSMIDVRITELLVEDVEDSYVEGSGELKNIKKGDTITLVKKFVTVGDIPDVDISGTYEVKDVVVKKDSIEIKCNFSIDIEDVDRYFDDGPGYEPIEDDEV